jgi:nucleotide-binding universal stress UspA family protein
MKVLVATDGSASAQLGVELARGIDWPQDTQLHVISVVPPPEPIFAADWVGGAAYDEEARAADDRAAQQVAEQAAQALRSEHASVDCRTLGGRPASQIVDSARALGVDLVIMGSRGHGTIASMVLGSVSAEVVDHAPCPVLVARSPRLQRVLLGHDGSQYAMSAEQALATLPIFRASRIEVITALVSLPPWTVGLAPAIYVEQTAMADGDAASLTKEYRAIAEASAQRLRGQGFDASAVVYEGQPAAAIIDAAAARKADLVVVGTHGRTGLQRLMLGSVARNVMQHAPCSVLVVRPTA